MAAARGDLRGSDARRAAAHACIATRSTVLVVISEKTGQPTRARAEGAAIAAGAHSLHTGFTSRGIARFAASPAACIARLEKTGQLTRASADCAAIAASAHSLHTGLACRGIARFAASATILRIALQICAGVVAFAHCPSKGAALRVAGPVGNGFTAALVLG